jgi:hypothetical protein
MPKKEKSLTVRECLLPRGSELALPERLRMQSRERIRSLLQAAFLAFVYLLFIFAHGQRPLRILGPIAMNHVVTLAGRCIRCADGV